MTTAPEVPNHLRNGLRDILSAREAYGLFLVTGNSMLTEAATYLPFDWAVVDLEGGTLTRVDALHQVQALNGSAVTPIIRVSGLDRHSIEHALDLGVPGVMIPKVDTAEDAELAARFTRYPPRGTRGVNPIRAGGYYNQSSRYFSTANQEILCIVQIESQEAVRNVDKIAATDGVDLLFIGANDLAMDLGQPGDPTGPAFDEARRLTLEACAASGKSAGIFAGSLKAAREYAREGFRFIAIGNEVKFFVQSAGLTLTMLAKDRATRTADGR